MKYLIANWKMHDVDVQSWLEQFLSVDISNSSLNIRVSSNLFDMSNFIEMMPVENMFLNKPFWMAQDVSQNVDGAYTGQISSKILKKIQTAGCIVGHSELRENGDSNEIIYQKGCRLKEDGISPIVLCVGESLEILEKNEREIFLVNQLKSFFKNGLVPNIVAYEPIWAIGTGKSASIESINAAFNIILNFLKDINLKEIPILYGGSVSLENIEEILSIELISGCLVGNSSLDGKEFARIAAKF